MLTPTEALHSKIWKRFQEYIIVGGLPEVVNYFVSSEQLEKKDSLGHLKKCREIQENLIIGYIADMAKHAGKENSMFLERLIHNIAEQLGHEHSSKFKFKGVFPGKKTFQDFDGAIDWLKKAGLIYQVPIVENINTPLSINSKINFFKLYLFDTGVLGALLRLPVESLLKYDFSFKGFIAENFILQEGTALTNKTEGVFYCYKKGESEIEFITDHWGSILPIEVKAGTTLHAKSLGVFIMKHKTTKAIRFSKRLYSPPMNEKVILDLPLFCSIK